MRHPLYFLLVFPSLLNAQTTPQEKPFLSTLAATKNTPLYTTYAAAMKRSEFTLDEGYHFLFYDSTRGAEFVTDNAGDWALGFRKGSKFVYTLSDMFQEPVITLSYPDIVKYFFYPFENIKVDVTFLVHSSHIAIQDINLRNLGTQAVLIDVLPFIQNNDRAFSDVQFMKEKYAVAFSHEEFPDNWTLRHGVPYVDKVHNIYMFSEAPDRMSSFRSFKWGPVEIPQEVDISKRPVYVAWGTLSHKNKERCRHRPPSVKMMVLLNNDPRRILIENAPRWGSAEANINPYGVFAVELGNFGRLRNQDAFTVILSCSETEQDGIVTGFVGDTTSGRDVRIDAILSDVSLPKPPEGLKRDIWGSGRELRLYWKGDPQMKYNVYRRDYRSGGIYELVGYGIEHNFYTDKNIPGDKIYGYVVTAMDTLGRMSMHTNEVNNIEGSDFLTDVRYPGQVKGDARDLSRVISASKRYEIPWGGTAHLRVIRGVRRAEEAQEKLIAKAEKLMREDLEKYVKDNENIFRAVPDPPFTDPDKRTLYWSAFALMRQVMLPPEGKCSFNYYVFSREPQWGWGHGGQVFHESITMLAYALMDPISAMNSQRVYRERQHKDGYINYRTGPYLDETIPHEGQLTTSAPWYAWENWEIYKISKDKKFLHEMYESSKLLYHYFVKNRDRDGDGLCEWGGEAVLESVRDGRVAVWDQVGYPSNFEALDLNCMLVQEEKALSAMALELGLESDAKEWSRRAADRAKKINQVMWDEESGFYYNVDRKTHTFTFKKPDDLKREEIIGFLPLWAGIADEQQSRRLVRKLKDPKKFWRTYGVPSLAADDPYYTAKGYWNGPVWVQWNYLIMRGLLDYGYKAEAKELVERVAANMIAQLKRDHNFWELYSPDDQWAGHHKTYIWAGIISRMMLDVYDEK
jgi:hypothetical protein